MVNNLGKVTKPYIKGYEVRYLTFHSKHKRTYMLVGPGVDVAALGEVVGYMDRLSSQLSLYIILEACRLRHKRKASLGVRDGLSLENLEFT